MTSMYRSLNKKKHIVVTHITFIQLPYIFPKCDFMKNSTSIFTNQEKLKYARKTRKIIKSPFLDNRNVSKMMTDLTGFLYS